MHALTPLGLVLAAGGILIALAPTQRPQTQQGHAQQSQRCGLVHCHHWSIKAAV